MQLRDQHKFFIDLIYAIPVNTDWLMQFSFAQTYEAVSGLPFVEEGANLKLSFKDEFRDRMAALATNDLFEDINYLEVPSSASTAFSQLTGKCLFDCCYYT